MAIPGYEIENVVRDAVSVVFITYNRSDLLIRAFNAIKPAIEQCGLEVEYIVSDDASGSEHQTIISRLPFDKHVIASSNQGMGANSNNGIMAASSKYILHIQDDWEFCGSPAALLHALEVLKTDGQIGVVQLASSMKAAVKETCMLPSGVRYAIFENDHLDRERPSCSRPYSDQPHLKLREFHNEIGPYREDLSLPSTELDYQQRVANQRRWYVATLVGEPHFRNLGAYRSFNPSRLKILRIENMESIRILGPILRVIRAVARTLRDAIRGRRT